MRKFYSYVLMATALLIGTNVWAIYSPDWLQAQFDAVPADGQTHTITMEDNITLADPVYLGTKTVDEPRKSIILDMNGHHITMSATDWVASKGNVYCSMFTITHGELLVRNNASDRAINPSLIQMLGTGYDNYNNIFNVAGSYKSSRWVKRGDSYEVPADADDDIVSVGTNTRDEGWFTHLEIGEGVKLVAENTIAGAGISIDGYYTVYHALVSPDNVLTYVFGGSIDNPKSEGALAAAAKNVCLYNKRDDAPAYNTAILGYDWEGFAYGLRVDVYGDIEFATAATSGKSYGIKLNGGLKSSLKKNETFRNSNCWYVDSAYAKTYADARKPTSSAYQTYSVSGDYYENHKLDTIDAPFLYVHSSAHISAASDLNAATAVYCSGYGKTLIEGECSGNSGVNIKSGTVELHDAVITGTASGYSDAQPGNHATGTGGVIVNSVNGRAGEIEVVISGDTKVSTEYGYAIEEVVNKTNGSGTDVSAIKIQGGTIEAGNFGAIAISQETADKEIVNASVSVTGGNIEGGKATVGGSEVDISTLFPNTSEYHTTEVTVNGKTVVVVSAGAGPIDDNKGNWETISAKEGQNVVWNVVEEASIAENETVTLGELQIIPASAGQTLTIANKATLKVNHLIMNDYARIIVEAGGKLIVEGEQGIVAPKVDNIVLKASETDQAVFLFHPNVTSNKYPNATVEFKSKAYLNGSKGVFQRFGVPTWDRETKKTAMVSSGAAKTWITQYDYTIDDWAAWTAYDNATNITIDDARPFRGYMLYSNNDKNNKMSYEFAGNLIGNQNEDLHMYYGWNYFANSYTAPISIKDLINTVMASLDADKKDYVLGTIYLYKNTGDDDYTWSGVNLSTPIKEFVVGDNNVVVEVQNQLDIQPMQAFLMRLNLIGGQMDQPISYKYDVYNPNMGIANNNQYLAPARATQANNEMQVLVSGEGSWDKVYVVENNNFSNDFENGYDAYKYDGKTGVNLYAMSSDARMEILATNDAEGTFLGIDAPKAGNYTLHVAGVEGMEYAIVDMETNAVINAVNGTKYQFYANAGANDYRFQVVKAAKIPTAIENTEAVKSAKGVYTLTGQFLGNDVNVLPAGVYIVNGVKVVK